jgi:phosphoglycerate kinase
MSCAVLPAQRDQLMCCCAAGGDSVSALKALQPAPHISYISTGGGAGLELIRGASLPGIQALADRVQTASQASNINT